MLFKTRKRKIKSILFLDYILTFSLLSIGLTVIVFWYMRNLVTNQIGQARVDLLRQMGERSNIIKNSSITISNLYNLDAQLANALNHKLPEDEIKQVKLHLDEVKKDYNTVFKDVGVTYEVVVTGNNGFQYSSQAGDEYDFKSLKKQLWYRSIYEQKGDLTFISSFQDKFDKQTDRYVFGTSRIKKGAEGKPIGTLLINIDENYLAKIYESALNGHNIIYIIDRKGNIISHANKDMVGMNFINVGNFKEFYGTNTFSKFKRSKGEYLISNYQDPDTGWIIIEEMPTEILYTKIHEAFYIVLTIIVICLVLALLMSYFISIKVSRPILALCNTMDEAKNGEFNAIDNIDSYYEMDQLQNSFNKMSQKIKRLLNEMKEREYYKRRLEQDFLKQQINPHFMYNTLFSIKCMVEIGKKEQASHMIGSFIDLLRMILREDTDLIPLKQEIQTTEKYLALQKIFYGNKFSYAFEVEEETLEAMVPGLILQPIVENAIFHGIKAKKTSGMIVVETVVKNDTLEIVITDDGIGMDKQVINKIIEKCEKKEWKSNQSIGISNVSNRIKINFGDNYGIDIHSEIDIGTTVMISLPLIRESEERVKGLPERGVEGEDFNCR